MSIGTSKGQDLRNFEQVSILISISPSVGPSQISADSFTRTREGIFFFSEGKDVKNICSETKSTLLEGNKIEDINARVSHRIRRVGKPQESEGLESFP